MTSELQADGLTPGAASELPTTMEQILREQLERDRNRFYVPLDRSKREKLPCCPNATALEKGHE